jgi:hypothetical protein
LRPSPSKNRRSAGLTGAIYRASAQEEEEEEEGGQVAERAGWKDLASIILGRQRQITTAGLVPAGLSRLWYHPVTQVRPPGCRRA